MKSICILLLGVLAALPASAEILGKPTVLSGDILMIDGTRVHLYGIDAPELDQLCTADGKKYRCGTVARTALMGLVAGVSVTCRLVENPDSGQAYAYCEVAGVDLSSNMVDIGWAIADRLAIDKYVEVERKAKEAKRGLWSGEFTPPWEWRER